MEAGAGGVKVGQKKDEQGGQRVSFGLNKEKLQILGQVFHV